MAYNQLKSIWNVKKNSLTSYKHRENKSWNDAQTIEMINKLSDEHAILKQNLLFTIDYND